MLSGAPQQHALFQHQLPRMLRSGRAFSILTSNCVSRRSRAHFFNDSTSKSAAALKCFGLDKFITFAPQRRVHFAQLSFQECSEAEVFLTFWFLISHPARWPRTRRFSESIFRPSGAPNYWKNTIFRDFPIFSYICIFFLLIFFLLFFFLLIFLFSLSLPCSFFYLIILLEI